MKTVYCNSDKISREQKVNPEYVLHKENVDFLTSERETLAHESEVLDNIRNQIPHDLPIIFADLGFAFFMLFTFVPGVVLGCGTILAIASLIQRFHLTTLLMAVVTGFLAGIFLTLAVAMAANFIFFVCNFHGKQPDLRAYKRLIQDRKIVEGVVTKVVRENEKMTISFEFLVVKARVKIQRVYTTSFVREFRRGDKVIVLYGNFAAVLL